MAYQGDVEVIHNWREEHSIEDLQRIVERKGYSAISVGSFDHAALKKFPYQLTADHCEPSPGYSNTLYIWNGRGGGSGALGIISSVQPADADEDEDEDEDWDEGGGACMAWGYQSEDQLACYGSVSGMTYDLDHPCWHELDANPTCCNYCGPWTSSEYESTCSALDIIRVSAGCCFSVQDSSGTEHHYDQDQNFCYNGVGCDSVRSVKVYDCSGGDEDEEPGEGSGGSLGKVEVGRVMSWYDYRARAKQEGGRLPTTAELRAAGVDVGYDQWTPITPSPGDQETGRRDGARGKDENAWANIGPRKYQIEYPAWGLDASEHPWKRLTYFYVVSDFGKDWDGFEDDESGALGIISSVQPTKTVNKRHMTPEQRAAARRGAGFSFADHPALSAVAALVGALAAAYGCATMRRADEAPKENPCCGGKYKEAQA